MSGMSIYQAIAMLSAAASQGATQVNIVRHSPEGHLECASIDWVSPVPVGNVAYISTLNKWAVLSNEAAESMDL